MSLKASVIIPVWNQLGYTRICVDYLLKNTPEPFELVIIDNGSTDGTAEYFGELKKNVDVQYIKNEKNLGPIVALNQGVGRSSGDILAAMHNDLVLFEKGWLSKLVDTLTRDERIGLAGLAGRRKIDKRGCVDESSLVHSLRNEDLNEPMRAQSQDVLVLDGVFISGFKKNLKKMGGFNEGYGLMHFYDLDISMRSRAAGFKNIVLNVEALHIYNGGMTRKTQKYKSQVGSDSDLLNKNSRIFHNIWKNALPAEV